MTKQKGFTLVEGLLIVLIVSVVGFAGYFVWNRSKDNDVQNVDNSNQEVVEENVEPEEQTQVVEEQSTVDNSTVDNQYFSLNVPEGFTAVDARIFTYTGPPESSYSFSNSGSGDYFEVNIKPAESGINADFVWNYTYENGVFTLVKTDSTVCTAVEDEYCETSGNNGRLDSAIFSDPRQEVKRNEYYFTFGNVNSEEVGDLSFVDQFIENLKIK